MAKISVIIPIYKVEDYLRQCIDSVLSQDYSDFEIILVEDGSPDNCGKICDEYALNTKVKVVHQTNMGISVARNNGLECAEGDWIMFLDSDDFLIKNDVLSQMVEFIQPEVDMIWGGYITYFEKNNSYVKTTPINASGIINTASALDTYCKAGVFPISAWGKLIRKSFLEYNKIVFLKGVLSEDIDWFCSFIDKTNYVGIYNNDIVAYRQRDHSISKTTSLSKIENIVDMISQWSTYYSTSKSDLSDIMLSFLAYELSIVMALSVELNREGQKEVKCKVADLLWLFQYTKNPKVKKVSLLYKMLRYNMTSILLHKYIESKCRGEET